ncbi:hypothetical protein [Williamsia sp. 1135]|uniref:hypothetical protein n=1 Tax=Williamsia sp. 1135 TaxID=1889262 RepID=UPI0011810E74|nr:hypothetical protein [Williamsia sp. 1135]
MLDEIYYRWQERHTTAELLHADCMLATDDTEETARAVLKRLADVTRRPDPDARVWQRMLLAVSRTNDQRRHTRIWNDTSKYFEARDEDLPKEVRSLEPKAASPRAGRSRRSGAQIDDGTLPSPITDETSQLARIIEQFGIAAPSALELGGVGLRPIDCTKRADSSLDFAGVLAGKWVNNRETFQSLLAMLKRFQERSPNGRARFLVIDPDSDAYQRLVQIRAGEVSPNSVNKLRELQLKFPCLEVRGIDHLPAFRVLVIDDDIVTVAPYDLENQSAQASRLGWEAPHMLLDPLATFPLAPAFRIYFDGEWNRAHQLYPKPRTF